ncbi:hypothetical protein QUA82_35345 [Microcoleus sp. F8-D3]
MGEAKRRQQVDPNYGKKNFKNNISRFDSWNGRYTTDGTPITRATVWACDGCLMIGDNYMIFNKGSLAGKIYYPTSLEGTEVQFKAPLTSWGLIAKHYGVPMPLFPKIENGVAIEFWDWVHDNNIPIKRVNCPLEAMRLLSQNVVAVFIYPQTNRPRENSIPTRQM